MVNLRRVSCTSVSVPIESCGDPSVKSFDDIMVEIANACDVRMFGCADRLMMTAILSPGFRRIRFRATFGFLEELEILFLF
jgi:hypothetical protein